MSGYPWSPGQVLTAKALDAAIAAASQSAVDGTARAEATAAQATAAGAQATANAAALAAAAAQATANTGVADAAAAQTTAALFPASIAHTLQGPNANYPVYSQTDQANHVAWMVVNGSNSGDRTTTDATLIGGQYVVVGSGIPSPDPVHADYVMQLSLIKQGWPTSTVHGELDGISVVTRNTMDDTSAFIGNIGTTTGFGVILEGVTNQFDNTGAVTRAVRVQLAATEGGSSGTEYSAGAILIAQQGTHDIGLQIQSTTAGLFEGYLKFLTQTGTPFFTVDKFGTIGLANNAGTISLSIEIGQSDGSLGVQNNAGTQTLALDQSGNLSIQGIPKSGGLATSPSYANDAAAATGGVTIGEFYRNGSAVMVRVT